MPENQICYFCGDVITKPRGFFRESLCMHHTSYDPPLQVPAHIHCHKIWHKKNNFPLRVMKNEYFEHIQSLGNGIICYYCGNTIIKFKRRDSDSLVVHHLNGDHNDWNFDNLTTFHYGCHTKYHVKQQDRYGEKNSFHGKHHTEKTKKIISESKIGITKKDNPNLRGGAKKGHISWSLGLTKETDPRVRRQSEKLMGSKHSELTKLRMRESKKKENVSERNKKAWIKRRLLYGPSGRKGVSKDNLNM